MTYTFRQARDAAIKAKKEVHSIVSISSDFEAIPWFRIQITTKQGNELLKDCQNFTNWVEQVEERPDRAGVKINGVWFWWDKMNMGKVA
jgi:hypothetical protein